MWLEGSIIWRTKINVGNLDNYTKIIKLHRCLKYSAQNVPISFYQGALLSVYFTQNVFYKVNTVIYHKWYFYGFYSTIFVNMDNQIICLKIITKGSNFCCNRTNQCHTHNPKVMYWKAVVQKIKQHVNNQRMGSNSSLGWKCVEAVCPWLPRVKVYFTFTQKILSEFNRNIL